MSQDNRCTFFPNGAWLECCVWHDLLSEDAMLQRSAESRLKADQYLRGCVTGKGYPGIADVMYFGVRLWYWTKWYWWDGIKFS